MTTSALRSLLTEPRPGPPPTRVWRDWVLTAAVVASAALEFGLRPDLRAGPLTLALVGLLVGALLWRRRSPLGSVAVMFGALSLTSAAVLFGAAPAEPYTLAWALVLPYALLRWGSGREAAAGVVVLGATVLLDAVADFTGLLESGIGLTIVLLPAALGAAVRFRDHARAQWLEQAKLEERQQLARELHDTVAHHVSAIAVQAQAGRAVAATDPAVALETLQVIERTATRTLDEMRAVVGALRTGVDADLLPAHGLDDLARLAATTTRPPVEVRLDGDLDDLGPALDGALYRLAQEAITNATRHARDARRVEVHLVGETDHVLLTVTDDGDRRGTEPATWGYGLTGMRERATLLGGTFDAGPAAHGGWQVRATLPRPEVRR